MARRFARLCLLGKESPMTATAEMPPPASGQNREFPVLFHLIDVSQPLGVREREPSEPPPRKYELPIWDEALVAPAGEEQAPKSISAADASELKDVAPEAPTAPNVDETPLAVDSPPVPEPPRIKQPAELNAGTEPVTPAERKQSRRREQTPTKSDWFTNQGKYIAICFVLALLGTIYVARTSRSRPQTAQPPVTHAHPGDAGLATAKPEAGKPEIVVEATVASDDKASSPAGGVTSSPAPTAEQPAVEVAGVDLHPPTPPQLAREETEQTAKDQDSLFPWANRTEERVATRPEPPPAAASFEQPVPPQAQYPVTNYRGAYAPAEQHIPHNGGPVLNAPGGRPTTPSNPPTGYRYERTGSGLY